MLATTVLFVLGVVLYALDARNRRADRYAALRRRLEHRPEPLSSAVRFERITKTA